MAAPEATLRELIEQFPLPAGLEPPAVFTETAEVLGGRIYLAGLSLEVSGETLCGSAAAPDELPLPRAYFELLERLAVVRAMARPGATSAVRDRAGRKTGVIRHDRLFHLAVGPRQGAARSNGVAAGASWDGAFRSAHLELLERDRVLRCWYGDRAPIRVSPHRVTSLLPEGARRAYDLQAYELGSDVEGVAAGVFLFPRGAEPLSHGFAARETLDEAVQSAGAECVQRLGFLWGEAIPASVPEPAAGPDYHQEFYLVPENHARLRSWLSGEHVRHRGVLRSPDCPPVVGSGPAECVDLTPPELVGRLWIARALHPGRVPLVFGGGHPWLVREPDALRVHPLA